MDDTNTPGIGDNNPPTEAERITQRLAEDYATLTARKVELLAGMVNFPESITDEDTCEESIDFIKQLKLAAKEADKYRTDEKAPHNLANTTIQEFFKDRQDPLDAAAKKLLFRVKEFQDAKLAKETAERLEAERVAKEESDRLIKEAEEAEKTAHNDETLADAMIANEAAEKAQKTLVKATKKAAATTNIMTKTKSAAGTSASMSTFPDFRNLDMAKIGLEALRPFFTQDMIEQAIRGYMRHNKETIYSCNVAGVEFFKNTRPNVR